MLTFSSLWTKPQSCKVNVLIAKGMFSALHAAHCDGKTFEEITDGDIIYIDDDFTFIFDTETKPCVDPYNDCKDAAFMCIEVITTGNAAIYVDEDEHIFHDDLNYLEYIEEKLSRDYTVYEDLNYVLLDIFRGKLTTAYDVLQKLNKL